jgi:hypothetical protein
MASTPWNRPVTRAWPTFANIRAGHAFQPNRTHTASRKLKPTSYRDLRPLSATEERFLGSQGEGHAVTAMATPHVAIRARETVLDTITGEVGHISFLNQNRFL